MKRIYLLTGATGLLGSGISRKLIDAGEYEYNFSRFLLDFC